MDDPLIAAARAVLELGWPAIVLIQSVILWRAHQTMVDRYIAHLEGDRSDRTIEGRPQPESEAFS